MNLSNKGFKEGAKLNLPNKLPTLNPNAAEFVPSSVRSSIGNTKSANVTHLDTPGPSARATLDNADSNVSNNSDDDAQQYWYDQLPDDLIPDFKSMGEDELNTPGQLSLASLSLHGGIEGSRFSANSQLFGASQNLSPHGIDNLKFGETVGHPASIYAEEQPSDAYMPLAAKDKQSLNGGPHFTNVSQGIHYSGDSAGLTSDLLNQHAALEDASINPVEYLAFQFPGFAAESLADVFYANGCDLNLTVDVLTQLELQVDANFSQNVNPKVSKAPSFDIMDFPALTAAETRSVMSNLSGDDLQQASNSYRSPSSISRSTVDFASTVRKLVSQDSAHQKYERSRSAHGTVGSSRSSQPLTNSYNGSVKSVYGDKVRSAAAVRPTPVWLETGEAVANMYSKWREEARDLARLRNACFEQARQAYLIGNGALAKELGRKGQFYNNQMKEAHEKARETIYRQRNPVASESQMQDRVIDLHGLHVNEALHVLNHELKILKRTARSAGQPLPVMICVGTGHHTKGARTPARLPVAVEEFLLEEGLHFTQPQPGLLRVVIY